MQVILLEDVKGSGKKGQCVKVSDGYARNFLLPKNLAKKATVAAMNELSAAKASLEHKREEEIEQAKKIRALLQDKTLEFHEKSGKSGKLFGSITTKEISQQIEKIFKIKIDKRKILINGDIKGFGNYQADVKLHNSGIVAKIYIFVGGDEGGGKG
jgi:large subunit ribosomal protein L9